MIAVTHRRGLDRGQIGTGTRLGIALAPPVLPVQDTRQEAVLLFLAAELLQDRPQHRNAEGQDARRMGKRAFLLEDVALDRGPARAAKATRPIAGQPALFVQDGVPFLDLGLGQFLEQADLFGQPLGQAVLQELADLGAEGLVFR